MAKTETEKTSVSLGSRVKILDEIKTKEDRSRSAVIRRAIDYYYLMNYVPEVEAEKGEVKEIEQAIKDARAGKGVSLSELRIKNGLGSTHTAKSRKAVK